MKKLLQDMKAKLRGRAGESIAEVLVALLISAVALVMLASMISASTNMIQRSREQLAEYYAQNNVLTTQPTDGTAGKAKFVKKDGTATLSIDVKYAINDKLGMGTVVAYWE